nr:hypothetical protein [Tanacetum cinerariifolium]
MGYEKPSTKLTFYKAFFSSQWKFLIHSIFQSLSAKRTSWNKFSIAMASAVICLSKGQRFNFSRVFNSPMLHVLRVEMVINSPWLLSKNWLVQKQTALGKDTSNPLIVDTLLKTIWFSSHHITCMKSWLVQKQTTLGKDTSNPLIVDTLLKTIWSSSHQITCMKSWLVQKQMTLGQMATGKESSNPFMADAAEGFEQIIDFLSGSYINHALIVNPHVYIYCIKQFWNTAVVKRSGDVTRLQVLVDKKRIVITEEVVCEILQLNDAEGVICLPN